MRRKLLAVMSLAAAIVTPALHAADIEKGAKLQTLTNLHPDMAKRQLYTMNYQQDGLIPVCSEVIVAKMSGKELVFSYNGADYTFEYEKYTKNAGISFEDAVKASFGPACDKAKMNSLSQADKDGIKAGSARIGMSRQGVLFAMGRPPQHATPSTDTDYWLYWRNRFVKTGIQFDAKGKVSEIK